MELKSVCMLVYYCAGYVSIIVSTSSSLRASCYVLCSQ